MKDKIKGYTLIELCILLSVILILAAMAIPSFEGMRDRAKINAAKSAMNSLRLAQTYYKQDYGVYTDITSLYPYCNITTQLTNFSVFPAVSFDGENYFRITANAKDSSNTQIVGTEKGVYP